MEKITCREMAKEHKSAEEWRKETCRSGGTKMGMEGAMGHGAWTQETETLTKRE